MLQNLKLKGIENFALPAANAEVKARVRGRSIFGRTPPAVRQAQAAEAAAAGACRRRVAKSLFPKTEASLLSPFAFAGPTANLLQLSSVRPGARPVVRKQLAAAADQYEPNTTMEADCPRPALLRQGTLLARTSSVAVQSTDAPSCSLSLQFANTLVAGSSSRGDGVRQDLSCRSGDADTVVGRGRLRGRTSRLADQAQHSFAHTSDEASQPRVVCVHRDSDTAGAPACQHGRIADDEAQPAPHMQAAEPEGALTGDALPTPSPLKIQQSVSVFGDCTDSLRLAKAAGAAATAAKAATAAVVVARAKRRPPKGSADRSNFVRLNTSKSGQWGASGGRKKFQSKAAMTRRVTKAALRQGKVIKSHYKAPTIAGQVRNRFRSCPGFLCCFRLHQLLL